MANVDIKQKLIDLQNNLFLMPTPITCTYEYNTSKIIFGVDLELVDDYLVGRTLDISDYVEDPPTEPPDPFPEVGIYNITSNYIDGGNTVIEVDHIFITPTPTPPATYQIQSQVVPDDLDRYDKLEEIILVLDENNPSNLINYKAPTRNDYFLKIEIVTEVVSNFIENYQVRNVPHDNIKDISDFILLEPEDYITSVSLLDEYLQNVNDSIGILDLIFSENELYMTRLESLMCDIKIAQEWNDNLDYIAYYNVRSTQARIDQLHNIYLTDGQIGFSDETQVQLNNIKIPRTE